MTENKTNLITVVVPCYNHGKYLAESLDSLLIQSYENLEIIVVNDGSTDNTDSVIEQYKKFDKRIRGISLPENKGKWFCINKAIEESKGTIITCHDADDYSLIDRIARQHAALGLTKSVHNLCGFVSCWSQLEMTSNKLMRFTNKELSIIDQENVSKLVASGFNAPGINHYYTGEFETAGVSAMFIKELWTIGFRFNPPNVGLRIKSSEDSDFNTRVTLALGATTILEETPYLYRRNTSTNKEGK